SNRDRESTAFFDELVELEQAIPNLRVVFTMTQDSAWNGETRRVDAEMLRDTLDGELGDYEFLVAGPPALVESVDASLKAAGVPEDQILAGRFSGY
ncbi:MAG: glycine betaine catabolism, partial [Gaiellaceae bacterium]|nr:glycine betaine catabolism [Gaiellaceae bacterium]